MNNMFNAVKLTKPNTNVFDLSHDVKLSLNMGDLVPTMCLETVPGDRFNLSMESLVRMAPMVSPVMHHIDVTHHYFFVPHRLLWDHWEQYVTNTKITGFIPAFPTIEMNSLTWGKLADYLGIPEPLPGSAELVSALPFAAFQMIYNEYYRDQNLIPEVTYKVTDGNNFGINTELQTSRKRAWEHDYFTSALPTAQKGDAVDIPLGIVALDPNSNNGGTIKQASNHLPNPGNFNVESDGGAMEVNTVASVYDPNDTLIVEPTTINDFRRAMKLQEWLEKMARGGTRLVEVIKAHFGITSPDARLQRPEYITGSKSPIVISEVVNTTGTDDLPQGNMAGHGISFTNGNQGGYYCQEHGYIIGIMSILPKTAYQQGIPKHFLKTNDPSELYWPAFANIGEQPVLNKELYAYTPTGNDTFGYVPRYAEYKHVNSRVAGDFRTNLDFWHLGRIFATQPALNQAFIEANPDTRIFAVEDPAVDKLYAHVYHQVRAVRPMPKFGTPTF